LALTRQNWRPGPHLKDCGSGSTTKSGMATSLSTTTGSWRLNRSRAPLFFSGDKIPWQIGEYEIRYHHDGKHNVMVAGGPFEIYVSKPSPFDFVGVRSCLLYIISLCLEADPSLLPASAFDPNNRDVDSINNTDSHPSADDFRFWSEKQAKRIATSIKAVFGVEYSHGVILADANVTTLANRVLATMELSES